MKNYKTFNSAPYYLERCVAALFFAVICFIALHSFIYIYGYDTYYVSDWMINYQGGFVRRGLIGELLLALEKIKPYNLIHAILIIDVIFYTLFFVIIFRIFSKYKWSYLAAMFPVACLTQSMCVYRRDMMMLCLCALTFHLFFKYLKEKRKLSLILSVATISLGIIIYEPVFFVLVPVLILQYWYSCGKNKTLNTLFAFSMPLACMALMCIFRGNVEQGDAIWQSWMPYITQYGYDPSIGKGMAIQFMELGNIEVFKMHIGINFMEKTPLLSVITLAIVFTAVFFLCTHIPQIENKTVSCNIYKDTLGRILIFQLLVQLPLFTVLSCDYGRTIPMSIYTSFFLFHYSRQNGIKLNLTPFIEKPAAKVMGWFSKFPLSGNTYFYLAVLLLLPFQLYTPSLWRDNIVMHLYDKIAKYIL